MQRFELCVFLIHKERRDNKSKFDYNSEIADRLFKDLPLRREDDPFLLGTKHIYLMGNGRGKVHNMSTIKSQLKGE